MRLVAGLSLTALLAGCAAFPSYRDQDVPMTSMAVFDPSEYTGLWYEVASFEAPFQRGCENTRALYTQRDDGTLGVLNRCEKDGQTVRIEGDAWVVGPGRLKVSLSGVPFAADYWVLWVDDAYRTAVVGTPSGRAGWILNREPTIPSDRLAAAREVLAFNGYDLSALKATPQELTE
ncbi:lipocalin [Alphaproteobacteria bacterium GH1-50]|uniref:Outer membrane lipoprotein Blc n=2 Tax=Kangsaoukella pontilimi TaxID=2691042 RepID=A0A7C9INN8_9RHOB|nr:lipocalin [Kangsaoukella pontilimi]